MSLSDLQAYGVLSKAGFADANEMRKFRADIKANPNLAALSQKIDQSIDNDVQKQFLTVMGQKWKEDPQVFQKIEAEMAADPSLSEAMYNKIKTDPNAAISAVSQYKGSGLAALVNPGAAPSIAQNTPQDGGAPGVVATPVRPGGAPNGRPLDAAPEPSAPANKPVEPEGDDFDGLINASDETIRQGATKDGVRLLGGIIADKAKSFGVNKATTDGFKQKINSDQSRLRDGTVLADAIAQNMRNNPEFVRQLAKMAKDNSTMTEPFRGKAQAEMNKLMANPELLASDKYVKGLQQQMALAEKMKEIGLTGMMKEFFAESMGPMKSGMRDVGYMLAGFSGPEKVISMTRGAGLFPNIMINLDALEGNKNRAMAWGRYEANNMTAFCPQGKDGKYWHEVTTKGPDGKDVKSMVPNGQITIKTADGKDMKVIPSIGVLVAKQEPGYFDGAGKYVPGNYRVPVVTGVGEQGEATNIKLATLTPAQFAEYKKIAETKAKENGHSIKEFETEEYTAADAKAAGKGRSVDVVSVDKTTGAASPATAVYAAPQQEQFNVSFNPNYLAQQQQAQQQAQRDRAVELERG